MKKFLRPKYLPWLTLALAAVAALLRLWTLGSGPDESNLYEPQPLAWALLWIVTAAAAGLNILLTAGLKVPGTHRQNFPASIPGSVGVLLAALAVMLSGVSMLSGGDFLYLLTGLLGIASAMSLVAVAFARFKGQRPNFLLHAAVCLFFALRIFVKCRVWSNEPQIGVFILPFLASVCVMLAAYQQASFDVELGKRRHSLFWSLMGTFFCVAALPASGEPLFYILIAAWLMTNLCSLRRIKPKVEAEEEG